MHLTGEAISLGTSLSNPEGGAQENQFNWEDSDGHRMLWESKMTEDIDELLDPGGLIFEIMGPPFVSGRCLHFCTNMVYGLQGICGLTDADIKDVGAPFLLLL